MIPYLSCLGSKGNNLDISQQSILGHIPKYSTSTKIHNKLLRLLSIKLIDLPTQQENDFPINLREVKSHGVNDSPRELMITSVTALIMAIPIMVALFHIITLLSISWRNCFYNNDNHSILLQLLEFLSLPFT